jgi:hypothetical protein
MQRIRWQLSQALVILDVFGERKMHRNSGKHVFDNDHDRDRIEVNREKSA